MARTLGFDWLSLASVGFCALRPWLYAARSLAFVGFQVGFPWLFRPRCNALGPTRRNAINDSSNP
jgi:hypothetical protein